MLKTTEMALGQQKDKDSRSIVISRQRVSSVREWDELEQAEREQDCGPCCQCGLWTGAVSTTLTALSVALWLGFLMMVSVQLEIRFVASLHPEIAFCSLCVCAGASTSLI